MEATAKREVVCPYCGSAAELVGSEKVYGRDHGPIYCCANYPDCDAYVGVHRGTDRPKGTLADRETREWRRAAHAAFDPIWQTGRMTRDRAYTWLRKALGLSKYRCHIGRFGVERCREVVEICEGK